jgi:hypothetical protein
VTAQRPQPRLAYARCGAALAIAAVTVAAVVAGGLTDRRLAGILAALVIAAAAVDGLLRARLGDGGVPGLRASQQVRMSGG